MLALERGLAYVHEPFNPQRSPGWMGLRVPHWYLYVTGENEAPYREPFWRVLTLRYPLARDVPRLRTPRQAGQVALEWGRSVRRSGARPLVKDPIALFSAEWLAERFGMEVVVMIRHPAAFAGSLKRLGWTFDFRNWADQPMLLRDRLGPYAERIRDSAEHPLDLVDQAVLMWNAIHHVIGEYRRTHPSWGFVRYEDLAAAPLEGFRDLYSRLGLRWDDRARRGVERHSSERNAKEVPRWLHRTVRRDSRAASRTWLHRLTPEETQRVRAGTAEVASGFYGDRDWAPEPAGRGA